MGSSLGPALANIIMTELENTAVKDLTADATTGFYARYVDDTLLLIKPENIQKVLQKLNSFHKSLNFISDPFPGEVHFLDINIDKIKTNIYRRHTYWTICSFYKF